MFRPRSLVVFVLMVVTASAPVRAEAPTKRTRDGIYGRRAGLARTMDVSQPAKPSGAALVMIVSGGFLSSPERIVPPFTDEMLKRGYTVFAVVHGSQPKFAVPEIAEDVAR